MKKILFLVAIAVVATGCKTKQVMSTTNEVEVAVPCAEYKTDKTAMRATASAVSPNIQNAKDKAVAAARRELATMLSASVQRVLESFSSSYDTDDAASFASRTKDLSRQVTDQTIVGSFILCDKVTKSTSRDGKVTYHAYVALELGTEEILKNVQTQLEKAVSQDDKLRTDFEYEKFKEVFYEEMAKLDK